MWKPEAFRTWNLKTTSSTVLNGWKPWSTIYIDLPIGPKQSVPSQAHGQPVSSDHPKALNAPWEHQRFSMVLLWPWADHRSPQLSSWSPPHFLYRSWQDFDRKSFQEPIVEGRGDVAGAITVLSPVAKWYRDLGLGLGIADERMTTNLQHRPGR